MLFGVEKGFFMTSNRVHRLSALAIMIALDYLLTPILQAVCLIIGVLNIQTLQAKKQACQVTPLRMMPAM